MTQPQALTDPHKHDWRPWLVAFVAFTAAVSTQHEMWRDEVRAFSVATNAGSWLQLLHDSQEDGHPILWYAILRIGYGLTHSTLVLPVASLAIAAAAAFLMLRFAPFPFWMRVLAIFGAFLGYEYSVMSRNYGLGILLMFAACIFFSTRKRQPTRLGIILLLLANTSVHAAVASLLLLLVWLMDFFNPAHRPFLLTRSSVAAICIAVGGAAFGLWSAHPPPEMSYAFSVGQLRVTDVLATILSDPGLALMGWGGTNIAAAEQIPWASVGMNPELASRVIVDIALASIAWSLRRNLPCLTAAILAVFGFEVLFRLVYGGGLRHEGFLAFILISLCWIATAEAQRRNAPERASSIPLGLIPLLVVQTAALPWIAKSEIDRPVSSSKAFAAFIRQSPHLRNAILAGEPDFMMEPMPYYVGNRVFMPRQRNFDYRAHFDRGIRRKLNLGLGELVDLADSLACANGQPVLLAIGPYNLLTDPAGQTPVNYPPAVFRWNDAERSRLFDRGKLVFSSFGAMINENYNVFEIPPSC
ncbi:MAG TPA: hypothetical protein VES88_18390 [Gemmatimonadaceae bacterium]|nr:hypothetical protein [Gemmatimonadaceae bacterium]